MCVRRRNLAVVDQILGLGHGRRALAGGRAGERRRLGPGLRPRSEFGRGSFAPFPASSEIQRPRWESSPASAKRRSGNRYQRVLSITKMVYHAGQNIRGAKSCIRHSLCLRVMGSGDPECCDALDVFEGRWKNQRGEDSLREAWPGWVWHYFALSHLTI